MSDLLIATPRQLMVGLGIFHDRVTLKGVNRRLDSMRSCWEPIYGLTLSGAKPSILINPAAEIRTP